MMPAPAKLISGTTAPVSLTTVITALVKAASVKAVLVIAAPVKTASVIIPAEVAPVKVFQVKIEELLYLIRKGQLER
jgi:hypothetical protein